MKDALQLMDPEWDLTPGSAEWKILEAVAQQIENITYTSVLNDYHFDVDKKSGLELDFFMSLFGFSRIKARRATGEITLQRGTEAAQDYPIPIGTQVFVPATDFSPSLFFQTTISSVLPDGATEVSIPVQAVVAGTTGNVAGGSITGIASSVGGVTAVFNSQPISGGRDAESDSDLRDRWRRTAFRNISGTEDQFLALAFNEPAFVTRANIIGPVERYREQVELVAPYDLTTAYPWTGTLDDAGGGLDSSETGVTLTTGHGDRFPVADAANDSTWYYIGVYDGADVKEVMRVTKRDAASNTFTVQRSVDSVANSLTHSNGTTVNMVFLSSVTDSAYAFPAGGEVVGLDIGLTTQRVGRRSTDYEFYEDTSSYSGSIPAGAALPIIYVTTVGAQSFGLDVIIEVEHEYTPVSSRNEVGSGIADKVDMFVDGVDSYSVDEQFPMGDKAFGTDVTISDYVRDDGVNPPADDNLFSQLSKDPVVSIPVSITVPATSTTDAVTYYKDEDYWLVEDETGMDGSPRAADGIEWNNPAAAPTDAPFSATRQTASGKLSGHYSYVYTFEVDGVETLPFETPEEADDVNDSTHGKNDIIVPAYGGAGDVIWRKVYRSTGKASFAASDLGPFYLLKVIKNNIENLGAGNGYGFEDNKRDDALDTSIQPPKAPPPVDASVEVEYNYNRLIERLDAQVDLVRLIGMDTLVHAAEDVQLKFNIAVVLVQGMNVTDVTADINTNLFAWLGRKTFQNNVQIADLIDVVSNASGVDNVRLVKSGTGSFGLGAGSEAKNDVQKITATPTASPDADRDTFTIKVGDITSGLINGATGGSGAADTAGQIREILEAMSNIHEGNTYATQIVEDLTNSETGIDVDDNGSLHTNGETGIGDAATLRQEFYIQVDNEIMLVTGASGTGPVTFTVNRAQLGTGAATHEGTTPPFADVHILGDVAVAKTGSGTLSSPFVYQLTFLPNYYTGVNDWGTREVDLVVAKIGSDQSRLTMKVEKKSNGVGSGIQHIAANDQTVITTYSDDFYLDSNELPSYFGTDIVVKAQNTFGSL